MRTDLDPIHPRLIHHRAKLRKGIRSAHRKGPIVADQAPSAEEAHGEPCQEIRVPAPEEIVHNESPPPDPIQGGQELDPFRIGQMVEGQGTEDYVETSGRVGEGQGILQLEADLRVIPNPLRGRPQHLGILVDPHDPNLPPLATGPPNDGSRDVGPTGRYVQDLDLTGMSATEYRFQIV